MNQLHRNALRSAIACFAFCSVLPAAEPQLPMIDGDWWQVAGDPDLGDYTLNFGVGDDRFRIGTLKVAAREVIRHEGQEYIAALMPSLKGIRIAKLGWRKGDVQQRDAQSDPAGGPLIGETASPVTLNMTARGYRGIWYMNEPSNDEYVYKYSGGLGTYCAKHKPLAVYCEQVGKTFFCFGGTTKNSSDRLLHMVSYFDHSTKTVPRPTILLDKKTNDAHDNPVMSVDDKGHIWIFSTSHGTSRPSYIHRSTKPYDIDDFELVPATRRDGDQRKPITNFSYMQAWHRPRRGFCAFFTRYGYPAKRTICFMNSSDGVNWNRWQRLAAIEDGHYQISGIGKSKAGSMFNYHPEGKGLNWRTNLYYVETPDNGTTWQTVDGRRVSLPLTEARNVSLVHDYEAEGLNVYLKDLRFDENDHPVLLYITSKGYESGPKNGPRTWTIARWDGERWLKVPVTTSDNNYDMGELWMFGADDWRIIGPTESGPQPFNPGGEVAMWTSHDCGATWTKTRQMTQNSPMNHTYVRRVVNANPDFIALWADGHGRQPSESRLYFCDSQGSVFQLPFVMESDRASPMTVK